MKLVTTHTDYGFDIIDEDCREWQVTVRVTSMNAEQKFAASLSIFGIEINEVRSAKDSPGTVYIDNTTTPLIPMELYTGFNKWVMSMNCTNRLFSAALWREFYGAWEKCWSDPVIV